MKSLSVDVIKQEFLLLEEVKLHKRLYLSICACILSGTLKPLSRLPPSRDLAAELTLSRNTVLRVYDRLQAEGYVATRTSSGTFVADLTPDNIIAEPTAADDRSADSQIIPLSQRSQAVLNHASANSKQLGAFIPGVPDLSSYPHRLFSKLLIKHSRKPKAELLTYDTQGGLAVLKSALADYLLAARGVKCHPDQILITEGLHQALDLITRALCDPDEHVWVEDPGYWGMKNILRINDVQAVALDVDTQGIVLPEAISQAPRIIFVTPSHQYPLGPVMSLSRRKQLLQFARAHHSWIVEDDYDSEFRFSGAPIPSLQGLENNSPVIYIGTFSKTLYPGLRMGYVVLPAVLSGPLRTLHSEIYRSGHLLTQLTLAEFIEQGHYTSHIRKMRQLYGRRRVRLEALILEKLGPDFLAETNSNAGLHLVLSLPKTCDDADIARQADLKGIIVRPLSHYYLDEVKQRGLLLGFASIAEEDMETSFNPLVQIIRQQLSM